MPAQVFEVEVTIESIEHNIARIKYNGRTYIVFDFNLRYERDKVFIRIEYLTRSSLQ